MGKRARHAGLPVVSLADVHRAIAAEKCQPAPSTPCPRNDGDVVAPRTPMIGANEPPTKRPWLAGRGDTPVCNYSRKAKRLDPAQWTQEFRDDALTALRRDFVAMSARGPSASILKTWDTMRRRMMGNSVPVYPLTPEKITPVAAAFKACGYRSFSNYLSKANMSRCSGSAARTSVWKQKEPLGVSPEALGLSAKIASGD